jgi:transposase-like protein
MGTNSEAATAIQKKEMVNALEANMGNVTAAAQKVGITPRTHYRWLKEDDEYADATENMKDISYRRVKDSLIEKALSKIEKGDTAVLMKMLSIYLKKLPDEMERAAHINNVPLVRARIKYVDTREEAEEIMRKHGSM